MTTLPVSKINSFAYNPFSKTLIVIFGSVLPTTAHISNFSKKDYEEFMNSPDMDVYYLTEIQDGISTGKYNYQIKEDN